MNPTNQSPEEEEKEFQCPVCREAMASRADQCPFCDYLSERPIEVVVHYATEEQMLEGCPTEEEFFNAPVATYDDMFCRRMPHSGGGCSKAGTKKCANCSFHKEVFKDMDGLGI